MGLHPITKLDKTNNTNIWNDIPTINEYVVLKIKKKTYIAVQKLNETSTVSLQIILQFLNQTEKE